ncbi:MAG: AbrB/MazE/SpoVT family DNA-binding domain-containing protein [Syntrophomonadaceae bacterium]|nr:AbrB/MazE/SpoVT family DNA-binding domain-containing protein [Syntrophomonadaceae bacterium]
MAEPTGIVRRLDELGRIVIPKELRLTMDIKYKDGIEIFTSEDSIILKQYRPACIFCGNAEDTIHFRGKKVCHSCKAELVNECNVVNDGDIVYITKPVTF